MATKESKGKTAETDLDERIQRFEQSIGFKLFDYQKEWIRIMIEKSESNGGKTIYVCGGQRNCCAGVLQKYMQFVEKNFKEV